MPPARAASAGTEQRTLVRNARQLITLQGASGSRRGLAMSELQIIPNGALLIRNGLIEEAGPARRVENLAAAKNAREIDASGRIVMPAFCDPDVSLVVPPAISRSASIQVISRHNVELRAAAVAAERARYGCVTVGCNTDCATDIKSVIKVLRAQKALQLKPLRIRSVFTYHPVPYAELTGKWLPAIRKDKLAAVMDLIAIGDNAEGALREAAAAASAANLALRIRSAEVLHPSALLLALTGGAISIVAPLCGLAAFARRLGDIGCVRVIPATQALQDEDRTAFRIRDAIDNGAAIALSSSYRPDAISSFNHQFLLYLAVRRFRMTPEEALVATTYNAACSLRISHVTGSLEPGKHADLMLMDVDDYRDLPRRAGHHDVSLVMRFGQILSRRSGPLIPD